MTCLKITESQNGQIYPEDTFSHGAAHMSYAPDTIFSEARGLCDMQTVCDIPQPDLSSHLVPTTVVVGTFMILDGSAIKLSTCAALICSADWVHLEYILCRDRRPGIMTRECGTNSSVIFFMGLS